MGRVDQLTKVKGMFVHPSQVQKVLNLHPEIATGRLVVDRVKDQDVMTLEVEVKSAVGEGFVPAVEETIKEVIRLRGSVKIVEPGTVKEEGKVIEDVRTWD
jgi:phenylacetate-CoA ligase